MKHIKIIYEVAGVNTVAIALNTLTNQRFQLSKYKTLEKAEELSPKLLKLKSKNPSKRFELFLRKPKNTASLKHDLNDSLNEFVNSLQEKDLISLNIYKRLKGYIGVYVNQKYK